MAPHPQILDRPTRGERGARLATYAALLGLFALIEGTDTSSPGVLLFVFALSLSPAAIAMEAEVERRRLARRPRPGYPGTPLHRRDEPFRVLAGIGFMSVLLVLLDRSEHPFAAGLIAGVILAEAVTLARTLRRRARPPAPHARHSSRSVDGGCDP